MSSPRYAVYFAPAPEHPLWQAGTSWLGRDARRGQPLAEPARGLVNAPWRYGFHATLKAPLRLAQRVSQQRWLAALEALAAEQKTFTMPRLEVALLGDFLALRPVDSGGDGGGAPLTLHALADACVLQLDPLRAALSELELARQLKPALSPRQRDQVLRYGYGHVLEDWRFHMTLSDGLSAVPGPAAADLSLQATRHFAAALAQPLQCDALCVFTEPGPGLPFELTHRFRLGAR